MSKAVKEAKQEKKKKAEKELAFSYEAIMASSQFKNVEKDLLKVLLDESKQYSLTNVAKILKKELERVIK